MLQEERFSIILDLVNKNGSVTSFQLMNEIGVSESTIRRDLNELDRAKKIKKVFGGATSIENDDFLVEEYSMESKRNLHQDNKNQLGKSASLLIEDGDFIFLDSGTTVASMVPYLTHKNITIVTNSLEIGYKLAKLGHTTQLVEGTIKPITNSIVGYLAANSIEKYNFTKGFFGVNGISLKSGFTTPDMCEAIVKSTAIKNCKQAYVLADHSKFNKISAITFSNLNDCTVITDLKNIDQYIDHMTIIQVDGGDAK